MVKQMCKYGLAGILVFFSVQAGAQSYSGWQLYRTEGDLVFTRGGNRTVYQKAALPQLVLVSQDTIQTETGKAEFQISPAAPAARTNYSVLRLGTNTSLKVENIEPGSLSLELLYGQIRVVLGSTDSSITVRSGNSVVVLRDCDTVLEYTAKPGVTQSTQPALTIHCFRGQGEVTPRSLPSESAKLPLRANESLTIDYQTPFVFVERKAMEVQTLVYWRANSFSTAPLPMPAVEPARQGLEPVAAREELESARTAMAAYQQRQSAVMPGNTGKIKNGYIITGLLMIGAGAAMQGYGHFGDAGPDIRDRLFYGGYGALGMGAVFLFGGALYNPSQAQTE
ncbi:hypothetical protein AGMMS50230_00160 [Spirochaetia bacterium]|nr:hypothetical protein AGMMS50230_00160 [Spirochaetia bacterium]